MRTTALLLIVAFGIIAIVAMAYLGVGVQFAVAVAGIPTAAAVAFFTNSPNDKDKRIG